MSDYTLQLTTFEAGPNLLTGTIQGGHTYATIRDAEWTQVAQVSKTVDQAYLDELAELDPGDLTYRIGEDTARLSSEDEAVQLAIQWMREHAPEHTLRGESNGTTYYTPDVSHPANPNADQATPAQAGGHR